MWKQPTEKELGAPKDIAMLMRESVYWNSEGHLEKAPTWVVIQYVVSLLVGVILGLFLVYITFLFIGLEGLKLHLLFTIVIIVVIYATSYLFYKWAWKSYREIWYHFDDKNEIFTAILQEEAKWETIEIPYEEIDDIEYVQGPNGKALINSGRFEFETSREREKRFSSVTDLWPNLARMDVKMTNWPIELHCKVCNRRFGHHIGTAICPWDKVALIDTHAKGRFDPIEQNIDDLDRI